jgi:hypothetical protein
MWVWKRHVNSLLCALVGRFAYKSKCSLSFPDWMKEVWFPLIGYVPTYLTLPSGWFGLIFKILEDVEIILNRFWDYKGGSLMLKRWRTWFDPATEYFSFRHVWVLLPGFPLNLWNKTALMAIGNLLGRFLKIDEACLLSSDKRMARVLVELDLHAGLMDSIELEWRGHVMVQRLDYLGLPFAALHADERVIYENIVKLGVGFLMQRKIWKLVQRTCI